MAAGSCWSIEQNRFLPEGPQLFDLELDPGETENLAELHPERVAAMREKLSPWIRLGPVEEGARPDLSEAALDELRMLGYLDGG